jgi:ATP-dependent DNA helicase DinG
MSSDQHLDTDSGSSMSSDMHAETDPGSRILSLFSERALRYLRREISRAGFNEVLFFGWFEGGVLDRLQVAARGNRQAVGVPFERSQLPDIIIHNHPGGELTPSDQDVLISSRLADSGVGFVIADNQASRFYVVVEPVPDRAPEPLDIEEIQRLLGPDGPFSRVDPAFEQREGQLEMAGLVAGAFNDDQTLMVEAGTGIGKSLAYLLPAVHWALANREKVVISTNTINLQEQLLHKDLPQVQRTLGVELSYVLMKGRGNYVCINRFREAEQEMNTLLEEEEVAQFRAVAGWLSTTETASLSELPFVPDQTLWEKINAQTGTCLGGTCAWFGTCPVNRVKRQAARAHIIVSNNHYLLADAVLGDMGGLLPPFRRLILDEAHNLENAATSFFTQRLTRSSLFKVLGRLQGAKKGKGYLASLSGRKLIDTAAAADITGQVGRVRRAADGFFSLLEQFTQGAENPAPSSRSTAADYRPCVLEVNEELRARPGWEQLCAALNLLYQECSNLVNLMTGLREDLERKGQEQAVRRIDGFTGFLVETVEHINRFLGEDDRTYVRWIEKRGEAALLVSVIDVGEHLQQLVFSRMKTVILTSATLTVGGEFDFFQDRFCLSSEIISGCIPSPFDYKNHMLVLIPSDLPFPDQPGFTERVSRCTADLIEVTGGRAFVLFTSHRMMNEVYELVKRTGPGSILLKQGEASRRFLLERFKNDTGSVLFGTESFWEGVDAPGRTLECVILTRLPFRVPTEPVIRARSQRIREQGGDPFPEYQLPLAVIKLKQGIGRLIRNTTDRGIIAIFDRRVVTKSYGRSFLDSLPETGMVQGTMEELLSEARSFLGSPDPLQD